MFLKGFFNCALDVLVLLADEAVPPSNQEQGLEEQLSVLRLVILEGVSEPMATKFALFVGLLVLLSVLNSYVTGIGVVNESGSQEHYQEDVHGSVVPQVFLHETMVPLKAQTASTPRRIHPL